MDINLDFNIDNYTDNELINLLDIDIDNPNQQQIRKHINDLKFNRFFNDSNIVNFLNNIETRLLDNETNFNKLDIFDNNNIENKVEAFTNMQTNSIYNNNNNDINNQVDDKNNNEDNHEDDGDDDDQDINDNNNVDILYNSNQYSNSIDDNSLLITMSNELINNKINFIYYHFNTLFRANSSQSLNTDCEFIIPSQINNVSQIRLASIKLKQPYLISSVKANNKFNIELYNDNNENYSKYTIILPDGYYNDINDISFNINKSLQDNSLTYINYNIDYNSYRSFFKIDIDNKPNNLSYIKIDFKSYYSNEYSLARILGYDHNTIKFTSNDNNIIYSTKSLNNTLTDLYFCLDEYQSNIIETHKIVLNRNMLTQKVLSKIPINTSNKNNNFEINEIYSSTKRYDTIRYYSGLINITKFNIKIIDNFGHIVNQEQDNQVEFSIEFKVNQTLLRL